MWILSPLSFYWMWQNLPFEKEISVRFGFRYAFYALLALVIVIPVSMATFWYFNHGYEFIWMPMSSSRWALGTWGYVLAGVGGWWALVWEIKLTRKVISDVKFTWNERGK